MGRVQGEGEIFLIVGQASRLSTKMFDSSNPNNLTNSYLLLQ